MKFTQLTLAFGLALLSINAAFSQEAPSNQPVTLTKIDKLENYTGITYLAELITDFIGNSFISHKVKGFVHLTIKFYSLNQFLKYKIKSLKIKIVNSHYQGLKINYFTAQTLNSLNGKIVNKNYLSFNQPVEFNFKLKVSQTDVATMLNNQKTISKLKAFKIKLPDFGEVNLSLLKPTVSFDNDKLIIKALLVSTGASVDNGSLLTITGRPALDGSSFIVLKDLSINSCDIIDSPDFSQTISKVINPILNLYRYRAKGYKIELSDLKITNHKVLIMGKASIKLKNIKLPKQISLPRS